MRLFSAFLVSAILINVAFGNGGKFYDLQEDGTILCDSKADCPEDVPGQENNTVLEFACWPRSKIDEWDTEPGDVDGTEPIIIYEEWYKNQTVCGEEYVDTCCTNFAKPGDCIDFDFDEICKKNNSEIYGGHKPEFQVVSATQKVTVTVPPNLRQKCERGQCRRRKRVRGRGVINICCNLVVVRGIFSCPPRTDERAVCNELS